MGNDANFGFGLSPITPSDGPTNCARSEVQRAYQDFWARTLVKIPGDLSRMIYVASLRDYNSGRYHHAGLEAHFAVEAVRRALEKTHLELFWRLSRLALRDFVSEVEQYMVTSRESVDEFLHTWRAIEPYRVAIPLGVDTLMAELMISNLKLGLEVLQTRRVRQEDHR